MRGILRDRMLTVRVYLSRGLLTAGAENSPLADQQEGMPSEGEIIRTLAAGEGEKSADFAGQFENLILEDIISSLTAEEKRQLIHGKKDFIEHKIRDRAMLIKDAIVNELFFEVASQLANLNALAGMTFFGTRSNLSGYVDLFQRDKIERGRDFQELIHHVVQKALQDPEFRTSTWRDLGGQVTNTGFQFSYKRQPVSSTSPSSMPNYLRAVFGQLKQTKVLDLLDFDLAAWVQKVKSNLFYDLSLLDPNFSARLNGMRTSISQRTTESSGFQEIVFVPTSESNRRQFLSVELSRSQLAGSKWKVNRTKLNVMEHSVEDLARMEVIAPDLPEVIFKSLLQVESVRTSHAADIINHLIKRHTEDEAFRQAASASYVALVARHPFTGGDDVRKSLARTIWFREVLSRSDRGIRMELGPPEAERIVKEFLYGNENAIPARMPYINPKIAPELAAALSKFHTDAQDRLIQRVDEIEPPKVRTLAMGEDPTRL